MSYPEKRTLASIFTGILVLLAYCIAAYNHYTSGAKGAEDLRSWAVMILVFIGIGVVAIIIVQIIFHILLSIGMAVVKTVKDEKIDDKEIERTIESEMVEDEMDKLIELKSNRIGFILWGFGFVGALVSVILGYSAVVMLNIIFLSCMLGSIAEGFAQIYFYRRGVGHA
jgi:hypothetical protein